MSIFATMSWTVLPLCLLGTAAGIVFGFLPGLSATMGVELNTLAWTRSMGTDIGGSATPIGASANVAGTAIAAREGHPISWGRYCKYSAPAAVIVVGISMVIILLRY